MDVLVFDESLVEFVYSGLLIKMVKDIHVLPKLGSEVKISSFLDALAEPYQKCHNLVIYTDLITVK